MIKKRSFLFFVGISLLLISLSFMVASTLVVDVKNISIQENYSQGDVLTGNFTLDLKDVNPNAIIRTNLGHSISLRDFLINNSKELSCESFNCSDRYVASSEGFETGQLEIGADYGFKITEHSQIDSISELSFDLELNFPEKNEIPVKINFFESGLFWSYQEPSNNFVRFVSSGCYDPTQTSTNDVSLSNYKICETITDMPSTKRAMIGVNYTLEGTTQESPRIEISLSKQDSSLYDKKGNFTTPSSSGQHTGNIILDYDSPIPEGNYSICVQKLSGSREVKISRQVQRQAVCGYTPYSLFVKIPTYASINSDLRMDLDQLEEGQNIRIWGRTYLNKHYGLNCSQGCILPMELKGTINSATVSNIDLKYRTLTNPPTTISNNNIFPIEKSPLRVNFQGEVKLEKADFIAEFNGTKNLEVYLDDGENNETLIEKTVRVTSIPMKINSFYPLSAPAGVSVLFRANVFSISPVVSYEWNFGDGTTKTTSGESVLKVYENITLYNVTLKATNNIGQIVQETFIVETINPREYLNQSLDRKKQELNKIFSELNNLTIPLKENLRTKINITQAQTELNSIEVAERTATTEQQFLDLALRIQRLDFPKSVYIANKIQDVFITDYNKINLAIINAVFQTNFNEEGYKMYISNWERQNVEGEKEISEIMILNSEGNEELFARVYEFEFKPKDEAYLIIQSSEIESNTQMESVENGKSIKLTKDQQRSLNFISFSSQEDIMYVSPNPSQIEIADPSKIGVCNYNKVCEGGENWKNCRHDCRAWPLIIGYIIGIFLLTIVAYTFVQIQFKKKYELTIFQSKQELDNLVESIRNSKEHNILEKEFTDKLIKNGWSKEQIKYAIKKSKGEKTRPYELIPLDKIFMSLKGKQINQKNEKNVEKNKK